MRPGPRHHGNVGPTVLDGRMPTLHWVLLAASALAMVVGVVNLFGVEAIAASAAATLVQ